MIDSWRWQVSRSSEHRVDIAGPLTCAVGLLVRFELSVRVVMLSERGKYVNLIMTDTLSPSNVRRFAKKAD